ncbi:MAG: hypothetical protein AAGJ81_15030 [Verrucomicrobiota bacterium]
MKWLCLVVAVWLPGKLFGGIELSVSPSVCHPGDTVEVSAEASFEEFAEVRLRIPEFDSFHTVSYLREPLQYEAGRFSQRIVWVFQPVHSGVFSLEGLEATIQRGNQTESLELPSVGLEVIRSSENTDGFQPELLGTKMVEGGAGYLWWVFLSLILAIVLVVIFLWVRGRIVEESREDPGDRLFELEMALEGETPSLQVIESILEDGSLRFGDELRQAMEQAVYGRSVDFDLVRELVEKERVP